MKIFLSSDHAGFELKEQIKTYLVSVGNEVEDCGAFSYVEVDDYSDTIPPAIEKLLEHGIESARAIVFGGSGQGEAIIANRYKGIRAGLYYGGNLDVIRLLREHNNANVLSLGARMMQFDEAKAAVEMFIETDFSNEERHTRRIVKIDAMQR
jgi:ribose 5-phosphate isomerase B